MGRSYTTISRREMLQMSAGATVGAVAGGCAGERSRPNLLFVFSDQQRRHALGCMNSDPVLTPHLDRFAEQSVVFTNALSACPICTAYRGTLLSGRYPTSTGVTWNGIGLKPEEISFGDALKSAGYQTGYIGKWHLYDNHIDDWREWHFNERGQYVPPEHRQGFDYWHVTNCNHRTFWRLYYEDDPEPVVNEFGWQPEHEVNVAIDYMEQHKADDTPFALFVSMVPPHNTHGPGITPRSLLPGQADKPELFRTQYAAPEEFEDHYRDVDLPTRENYDPAYEAAVVGYFGACTGMDHYVGQLFDYLDRSGLADNTVVVYTSDHGDMVGSHSRVQKVVWYEESVGIPFLIRWPGVLAPGRQDCLFNSVDVMPTILGLLGADIPAPVEGTDLSPLLHGRSMQVPESALLQCGTGNGTWKGLRTHEHTFVTRRPDPDRPTEMFYYDNINDPYQMRPLSRNTGHGATVDDLRRQLIGWLESVDDPWREQLV